MAQRTDTADRIVIASRVLQVWQAGVIAQHCVGDGKAATRAHEGALHLAVT